MEQNPQKLITIDAAVSMFAEAGFTAFDKRWWRRHAVSQDFGAIESNRTVYVQERAVLEWLRQKTAALEKTIADKEGELQIMRDTLTTSRNYLEKRETS